MNIKGMDDHLDLKNVQTFVLIARDLSFAKAAQILHLSQPSVTARIQALETELGKSLFIRQHRGIQLSKEGEAFMPFALQMLEVEKAAEERLKSLNDELQGKIVIGATASCSVYILPEILSKLLQYPKVEFQVVTGNTSYITEMLLQNQVDFGMVSSEVKKKQIKQVNLCDHDFDLVCSPMNPLAAKGIVSMEDLIHLPLITYEQNSDAWKKIKKLYAEHDSAPKVVMELNQIEAAKEMVNISSCVCIFPNISVRRELSEGRLVKLKVNELEVIKQYSSMIYMEKKEYYPLMELMINTFLDYFISEPLEFVTTG
ncbi:LysR family transcriptional regulator [Paenibacillus alginolyticus]|uniref:LysR family transcriptional regulator n=1 Tax=Paenibacillus alginolyticus TaxID=59839 RepID=A0ABT4G905_9BACL|nr:LysR family transcriptional regulator [Paenibacillus alginolyticus]MCY9692666.1 LysR family transcriptional regulator [Paenibacillus alginolyticus]MEC0148745.1 LysR family transcriptional regulator [Paenibacillus alginolyticus]